MFKRILIAIQAIIGKRRKKADELSRYYQYVAELSDFPGLSLTQSSINRSLNRSLNPYFPSGLGVEKLDSCSEVAIGYILHLDDSIIWLN